MSRSIGIPDSVIDDLISAQPQKAWKTVITWPNGSTTTVRELEPTRESAVKKTLRWLKIEDIDATFQVIEYERPTSNPAQVDYTGNGWTGD